MLGRMQVASSRSSAWKLALALGALALLGAATWLTVRGLVGGSPGSAHATVDAPEFELASLDGGRLGPGDYRGKVLLLDFWATWCTPCHFQAKILRSLYEDFRGPNVEFLAVSVGEDEEIVRRYIDGNPYPYPVLVDPHDRVSAELGIYALPTLMILDAKGRVAYFQPGISDAETLRRALEKAGASPATTVS